MISFGRGGREEKGGERKRMEEKGRKGKKREEKGRKGKKREGKREGKRERSENHYALFSNLEGFFRVGKVLLEDLLRIL